MQGSLQGFFPRPLLRSLQRFTQREDVENGDNMSPSSVLACGTILGTRRDIMPSGNEASGMQQVAVWGLLHPSPDDTGDVTYMRYLPGGISCIGRFVIVRGEACNNDNQLESAALQATSDEKAEGFVLVYEMTAQALKMFHCKTGKATLIEMQVVQCLHAHDFYRVIGFAPLRCMVDFDVFGDKNAFIRRVEKYVAATHEDGDFYVRVGCKHGKKGRGFYILNERGEDVVSSNNKVVPLESILPEKDNVGDYKGTKSKKKNDKKHIKGIEKATATKKELEDQVSYLQSLEYGNVANIELLISLALSQTDGAAPVLTIPALSASKTLHKRYHAHCEAFVVVPVDSSMEKMLALLRHQLYNQLTNVASRLKPASEDVDSITTHQFPLIGAMFPLTLTSSANTSSNNDDVKTLEDLHRAFLQPLHQPLFRLSHGCSLAQQGEWLATSNVLVNVHEGVPSSGLGEQSQSALVDGFYGYYHYLQQGINDKGWGCAYRSLQTLASWLFLQHYTQHPFLSHEQIQRVLVKIGDKPAQFQGSTEWIGSLEVGYVLDELFGVTFRSLSVPSGTRLPDVARELLYHFETQGSPVMMGGGQLAFTLLGVDYHPDTGVCAFLTLDPHYTGDENLATIQHQTVALEGYKAVPCSWRKTTSFAKGSFYNLCLPQRPRVGV